MKAMTLRLDPEVAEQLGIVARVDRKPVADVIREAIARYVEKRSAVQQSQGLSQGVEE